jgi:hypothetical protein
VHVRRPVRDGARFRGFAESAKHVCGHWPFTPLLGEFWRIAVRDYDRFVRTSLEESGEETPPTLMWCLTRARREIEWKWGCNNRELFLVTLNRQYFVAYIVNDLSRFHAMHNHCVAAYRVRHRMRSRTHPVPDLAVDGDFLEAPFWWYDAVTGQRHRLFVRSRGDILDLRPGLTGDVVSTPKRPNQLAPEMAFHGVHFFTRALTTTMFIRLCVADLFIHGIGGAKYDEVTDDIIRRYFGIEPPEYLVVTGTLHLPFSRFEATPARRQGLLAFGRNLHWNPQRFVDMTDPTYANLHDEKMEWLARKPQTHAERRERYRMLLRLTEALRPAVAKQEAELQIAVNRCDQELAANEILFRRDYPFVLYPDEKLKPFCTQLLNLN